MTSQMNIQPHTASVDENATTRAPDLEWDVVAQASWESFPASDPPGWINTSRRDQAAVRPTDS